MAQPGGFDGERSLVVDPQLGDQYHFPGIVQLHTDLNRLRRNWFNNTQGLSGQGIDAIHVNESTKVLALHRWDEGTAGDDTVCIANLSGNTYHDYRLGFPSPGLWRVRLNTDWSGYSPDFGNTETFDVAAVSGGYDRMPAVGTITVGPHTALILSKDRGT